MRPFPRLADAPIVTISIMDAVVLLQIDQCVPTHDLSQILMDEKRKAAERQPLG
jgi:hypothetical protein